MCFLFFKVLLTHASRGDDFTGDLSAQKLRWNAGLLYPQMLLLHTYDQHNLLAKKITTTMSIVWTHASRGDCVLNAAPSTTQPSRQVSSKPAATVKPKVLHPQVAMSTCPPAHLLRTGGAQAGRMLVSKRRHESCCVEFRTYEYVLSFARGTSIQFSFICIAPFTIKLSLATLQSWKPTARTPR